MVDTKSPGDKTLSVPTKTLTLKPRVETGTVRQSFSHGRTKQVVVEKRGKRRVGGDAPATETHAPEPVVAGRSARLQRPAGSRRPPRRGRERSPRPPGHELIAPTRSVNAAASISGMRGSLEQMMSQLKTSGRKDFPLIIKADVQGSLEAILGSLEKLGTDEVAARILHAGVGGISESDVTLAEGFNAAIIGFSVRANKEAAAAAKRNGIEIRYYNIIYDLVDDIKKAMSGLLAPTLRETMLGNARSWKCSTFPRSARSRAAASPTAPWNAAPMSA